MKLKLLYLIMGLSVWLPSCVSLEKNLSVPAVGGGGQQKILLKLPLSLNFWTGGFCRPGGERVRFKGTVSVRNLGPRNIRISFHDKCAASLEMHIADLELAPQSVGSIKFDGQCLGFTMPEGAYLLEMSIRPDSHLRAFEVEVNSVPDAL